MVRVIGRSRDSIGFISERRDRILRERVFQKGFVILVHPLTRPAHQT